MLSFEWTKVMANLLWPDERGGQSINSTYFLFNNLNISNICRLYISYSVWTSSLASRSNQDTSASWIIISIVSLTSPQCLEKCEGHGFVGWGMWETARRISGAHSLEAHCTWPVTLWEANEATGGCYRTEYGKDRTIGRKCSRSANREGRLRKCWLRWFGKRAGQCWWRWWMFLSVAYMSHFWVSLCCLAVLICRCSVGCADLLVGHLICSISLFFKVSSNNAHGCVHETAGSKVKNPSTHAHWFDE